MIDVGAARVTHEDFAAIDRVLARDPIANAYLRSELRAGRSATNWWGVTGIDGWRAAMLIGGLTVPWIPDPDDAPALADALIHAGLPRMIVGDRSSVMALHAAMRPVREARQVRDPQRLLRVDNETLAPPAHLYPVRRASRSDLEQLVVVGAAMHREEMGIDPLTVDPRAWRQRMLTLVERGWSWVAEDDGQIVFKTELSAWTAASAQLQGVYVVPERRSEGLGRAALCGVIRAVLADSKSCSLYVNHYNTPALGLYAALGFVNHGDFATVIY